MQPHSDRKPGASQGEDAAEESARQRVLGKIIKDNHELFFNGVPIDVFLGLFPFLRAISIGKFGPVERVLLCYLFEQGWMRAIIDGFEVGSAWIECDRESLAQTSGWTPYHVEKAERSLLRDGAIERDGRNCLRLQPEMKLWRRHVPWNLRG